jgi:hypothetical protein
MEQFTMPAGKQPVIPIAANYVKVEMFIHTPSKEVTESHYWNTVSTPPDLVGALNAFDPIARARAAMLPNGVYIDEVRASVEGIQGDTILNNVYSNLPGPSPGVQENLSNDCLKVRIQGILGNVNTHTNVSLAGIPDDCIVRGAYVTNPTSVPTFNDLLTDYFKALCGNYGTLVLAQPGAWGYLGLNPAYQRIPITQILITGNIPSQVVTVTTKAAHGLAANDVVRLGRVPNASAILPWNQLWIVASVVDATDFTIAGFPPVAVVVPNGPGGTMRKMSKVFIPYVGAGNLKPGTRRRGTRTGLPLGRFKKKSTLGY